MRRRFNFTLVLLILTVLSILFQDFIDLKSNTKMYLLIASVVTLFYNIYRLENE